VLLLQFGAVVAKQSTSVVQFHVVWHGCCNCSCCRCCVWCVPAAAGPPHGSADVTFVPSLTGRSSAARVSSRPADDSLRRARRHRLYQVPPSRNNLLRDSVPHSVLVSLSVNLPCLAIPLRVTESPAYAYLSSCTYPTLWFSCTLLGWASCSVYILQFVFYTGAINTIMSCCVRVNC